MRRFESGPLPLALGCVLGVLVTLGCDEKKPEPTAPSAAVAKAAPTPVPPPKEVQPVEAEEAPKKKEPRVCKPGPVVDFGGDAALEGEVRFKLKKPKGDIAVADLAKVRSLNLAQTKVHELDACIFPHFTNLKELFLGAGKLDDLGPIADLKNLESLRASLNRVTDLKPLAKLTKMDRLDLGHTRVTDLSPLAGLVAMTELQLDDTPLVDLKPLATCKKLERLSIQRTNVKDIAPLKALENLKFLYTSGAPVEEKFVLSALVGRGLKIVDQ
jgi:internalin A